MRTSNPALNSKIFTGLAPTTEAMTIQGAVNKTLVLLLLVSVSAAWVWSRYFNAPEPSQALEDISLWMYGGLIGGFVMALVTIFKKSWAGITAPIYALLEGLFLGGISAIFEAQYSGIVIQAVGLTFGTLFCLLVAYTSRMIKVTQNFRLGVVAATGGIALLYLASMVLGFFGINIPYIHESGLIGIGFSLFVVVIAALNLVLDFDFIENAAAQGAPKYLEWYGAFGLIVTLVWLYLEMLRLLSKLRSRN
ncbi:MAG TPA: Bax inhibitor-1/YccA family protein [Anaerolineae bacterium]|nr:Bax inhibitor-1/YccA family protein [Anaerolineae bacterium]